MKLLASLVLCVSLAGCAGYTTYSLRLYKDPTTGQLVCCEAQVRSSRNVASVIMHATRSDNGDFTLDLTEKGISASAPIAAQNGAVSAVAGAVSNTAAAAVKLIP